MTLSELKEKAEKTIMKMYLMVGVPGSGKSFEAKKIQKEEGGVILSTDSLFNMEVFEPGSDSGNEVYAWDPQCLREAHRVNLIKAKVAVERQITPIIIDNTNLTEEERLSYVRLAQISNYEVVLREPPTSWKDDAEECFKRNSHGVPLESIKRMLARKQLWPKNLS